MYRGGIKQDWRVCEQKNRVEGVKGVISVLFVLVVVNLRFTVYSIFFRSI